MARKKYTNTDDMATGVEDTSTGSAIGINTILLGVIALALVVQTFMMLTEDDVVVATTQPAATVQPNSQASQTPNIQPTNMPANNQPDNASQQLLNPASGGAAAAYDISEKDFGNVQPGKKFKHTFKVTNTGTAALNYGDITGDPGVNIISTPVGEIPPGGSGEITVELNTADLSGPVSKNVHVNSNAQPAHTHLVLKANVQ